MIGIKTLSHCKESISSKEEILRMGHTLLGEHLTESELREVIEQRP